MYIVFQIRPSFMKHILQVQEKINNPTIFRLLGKMYNDIKSKSMLNSYQLFLKKSEDIGILNVKGRDF